MAAFGISRESLNIAIGGLVVLIGALVLVISYRGGQPGETDQRGYRLEARFEAIDGVRPGTDVLLTGIPVGEVERQYLDTARNEAVVVMRIRDGIEIPYDSSIKILSEGIAGRKYIKIGVGGDMEMLGPGDSFLYTQSAVRFEELLQKVILSAEARRAAAKEDAKADRSEDSDTGAGASEDGNGGLGGFGMPALGGDRDGD
ncbi:MCE family protein [Marivibrio halodurans]|uniref:MCE family protein n=1 Tax=Marivibrio halodurans TaxID=2039722 RepID=A0A8J7V2I2_9PROT|nr:MlaD family protein [Marivibrio halodurans]MBP5857355.1 MCE family protein [Marivibrio halodurans]